MNKKWRKPNNDCSKNWPVSTISFSSPKPPDRRRFPLRFMESLHAFFVAHWGQEPEIRKLFGIKPSVFRFMESLLSLLRTHWDHEPVALPLTRPSDTLSLSGREGWREGGAVHGEREP